MAKGSSVYPLFMSAFMLSLKAICNNTYSNKPWRIVSQGMFAPCKINQMEQEICSYLEWQLNVLNIDPSRSTLLDFHHRIQQDFTRPRPSALIVLPQPAPGLFTYQSLSNASSGSGSVMPLLAPHVLMPKESYHSCNTPPCLLIPQRTHTWFQPHPHLWYYCRCLQMHTGHSSRWFQWTGVLYRPRSSLTATDLSFSL